MLHIEWIGGPLGHLRLLDQTRLPTQAEFVDCRDVATVFEAIRSLRVRGAPAIGVSAAYGFLLGLQTATGRTELLESARVTAALLETSRPTAVNLFWALGRMLQTTEKLDPNLTVEAARERLLKEARAIETEDQAMCAAIGKCGADLIVPGMGVLTHCNAGALATAGDGTALAVIFEAARQGKHPRVFADETRPLLQGARLTAWELQQRGVSCTLICDSMAGWVMQERRVQLVIVGADRIAANGDTANKIGTYSLAVLARAHQIPFYVAAPSSTFDLSLTSGDLIPIEQRRPEEVTCGFGIQTAPAGIAVYNPAFDVTPAELIAGIITECGLISPVTPEAVRRAVFHASEPVGSTLR